jgi:hypothetical protein
MSLLCSRFASTLTGVEFWHPRVQFFIAVKEDVFAVIRYNDAFVDVLAGVEHVVWAGDVFCDVERVVIKIIVSVHQHANILVVLGSVEARNPIGRHFSSPGYAVAVAVASTDTTV